MDLINLQCDINLKQKFQDVHMGNFYSSATKIFAIRLMALFDSTYICEQILSQMKNNKSNKRNRLTYKHLQTVMKIISTQFSPRLHSMSESKRQQISSCSKKQIYFLLFLKIVLSCYIYIIIIAAHL